MLSVSRFRGQATYIVIILNSVHDGFRDRITADVAWLTAVDVVQVGLVIRHWDGSVRSHHFVPNVYYRSVSVNVEAICSSTP